MSARQHLMLAACCGLLASCTVEREPPADLPVARQDGRFEWHGTMPCADCDGIETRLVLERAGDARRYDLVETFHAEDGGARFIEAGDWGMDAAMVTLASDDGVARHYAVLGNGGLQPRDAEGEPLSGRADDVLMPVEAYAP